MARYKPGDRVRVRTDLVLGHTYFMDDKSERDSYVEGMDHFAGQLVTIKGIYGKKYHIEEFGCNWVDEMFVPVEEMISISEKSLMDFL